MDTRGWFPVFPTWAPRPCGCTSTDIRGPPPRMCPVCNGALSTPFTDVTGLVYFHYEGEAPMMPQVQTTTSQGNIGAEYPWNMPVYSRAPVPVYGPAPPQTGVPTTVSGWLQVNPPVPVRTPPLMSGYGPGPVPVTGTPPGFVAELPPPSPPLPVNAPVPMPVTDPASSAPGEELPGIDAWLGGAPVPDAAPSVPAGAFASGVYVRAQTTSTEVLRAPAPVPVTGDALPAPGSSHAWSVDPRPQVSSPLPLRPSAPVPVNEPAPFAPVPVTSPAPPAPFAPVPVTSPAPPAPFAPVPVTGPAPPAPFTPVPVTGPAPSAPGVIAWPQGNPPFPWRPAPVFMGVAPPSGPGGVSNWPKRSPPMPMGPPVLIPAVTTVPVPPTGPLPVGVKAWARRSPPMTMRPAVLMSENALVPMSVGGVLVAGNNPCPQGSPPSAAPMPFPVRVVMPNYTTAPSVPISNGFAGLVPGSAADHDVTPTSQANDVPHNGQSKAKMCECSNALLKMFPNGPRPRVCQICRKPTKVPFRDYTGDMVFLHLEDLKSSQPDGQPAKNAHPM